MNDQAEPLWRLMQSAYCSDIFEPDFLDGPLYAAEIEAVRDRVAPHEPEPTYPPGTEYTLTQTYIRWQQRQSTRAELTAEAERARRAE